MIRIMFASVKKAMILLLKKHDLTKRSHALIFSKLIDGKQLAAMCIDGFITEYKFH